MGRGVSSRTPNPATVDAGDLQEEGLNSRPLPTQHLPSAASETQAGVRQATGPTQQSPYGAAGKV